MSSLFTWQPPTQASITWRLTDFLELHNIDPENPGDNSFYVLYDRQVGEEGEQYEVLPGLFGRVTNYYVTHPGSLWKGSEVWILVSDAQDWLASQE